MSSIANEWYRWFSMKASDIDEGEHVFFRNSVNDRKHGVTLTINNVLCFVSLDDAGTVVAMPLANIKEECGGTLCRAAYGITDSLPRVYGVGNNVLRDSSDSISRRVRKSLGRTVSTDPATWAISVCISLEQGSHIEVGAHHGIVFLVDDEYRVCTVKNYSIGSYALWQFFAYCGGIEHLRYVDNTALPDTERDAIIAFVRGGRSWSTLEHTSKSFCSAVRDGELQFHANNTNDSDENLQQKLAYLEFLVSSIVGQKNVREALLKMARNAYSAKIRIARGLPAQLPEDEPGMYYLFGGPYATGKKTAAVVLAKILHWAGCLSSDRITHAHASDLTRRLTETAPQKTLSPVESAAGGLLLISEPQAISAASVVCQKELLIEFEKHKHNTAFVIAGCTNEILQLYHSNAGFHRFHILEFDPQTLEDLSRIIELKLTEVHLVISQQINLNSILLAYSTQVAKSALNGRFSERVADQVRRNHSARISEEALLGNVSTEINENDFALDQSLLEGLL